MNENWVKKFDGIWREPKKWVEKLKKETGKKVIGWAIPDGPEELILASSAYPLGLLGAGTAFSLAEAHFQGFACSYSRTLLEQIKRGELNYLDGVIFPHTCDAMRALDLVVKEMEPFKLVESYRPPRVRDNASAVKYFSQELERVREKLGKLTGHYAKGEELEQAIEQVNEVKELLKQVKKEMVSGKVRAREFFSLVQAGMVGDKKEVGALAIKFLEEVKARKGTNQKKLKIVLAGKVLEPIEMIDELEQAGFQVVEDLLVNGSRYIESQVELGSEPIKDLVYAQLNKIPIAGVYDSKKSRAQWVIQRVKESQAEAVIYLVQKFCEPYELEVVGVEEELNKEGIKVLRLESDYQTSSLPPLRTRIDAFAEMLGN